MDRYSIISNNALFPVFGGETHGKSQTVKGSRMKNFSPFSSGKYYRLLMVWVGLMGRLQFYILRPVGLLSLLFLHDGHGGFSQNLNAPNIVHKPIIFLNMGISFGEQTTAFTGNRHDPRKHRNAKSTAERPCTLRRAFLFIHLLALREQSGPVLAAAAAPVFLLPAHAYSSGNAGLSAAPFGSSPSRPPSESKR